ncbi:MAG TPA: substrate-binding domain-containing protein [Gaiellaceae bacterium]|nr:substrate-binding domain-containing protein [Gaiellaceae bacterium]
MQKVFRKSTALVLAAVIAASAIVVAAATASASKKAASGDVCVLLPDTASSVRWEHFDKPALIAAFKKAGVSYTITNADNDAQKQKTQADQCLGNGAKVLIEVMLDAGSASSIEKAAKAKGVPSIDYDRQVPGGVASIYVSFDGGAVGVLQGKGVVAGLKANGKFSQHPVVAELNGGSTDPNSFLFKGGYDKILKPFYKSGTFKKGPDQFVPGWDNQKAGTIFEQMLVRTGNKIDAVAAANDGLANAVVVALKAHGLKPVPLSGQDATPQGVQNIISGWQTMTVWKDTRVLAKAAAKSAIQLLKGQKLTTTGSVKNGAKKEPAYIIPPVSIGKSNWRQLYTSGFMKKSDICNGSYKKYC